MDNSSEPQQDRREWLRSAARYTILGTLGLGTAALVRHGGGADDCHKRLSCGQCALLGRCELPQAASTRRERKE